MQKIVLDTFHFDFPCEFQYRVAKSSPDIRVDIVSIPLFSSTRYAHFLLQVMISSIDNILGMVL